MPKNRRKVDEENASKEQNAQEQLQENNNLGAYLNTPPLSALEAQAEPAVIFRKPLPVAAKKKKAKNAEKSDLASFLYTDEKLDDSPPRERKPTPLSPYSKAKKRAEIAGVTLPHNWRDPDWYTVEALNDRINVVEQYNQKMKEIQPKAASSAKKKLFA